VAAALWAVFVLGASVQASRTEPTVPGGGSSTSKQTWGGAVTTLNDEELLIVQLRLGPYVLADGLDAYLHEGEVLLPLMPFFAAIDFPIAVNPIDGEAQGWFRREEQTFSLDLKHHWVRIKQQQLEVSRQRLIAYDHEIYASVKAMERWFDLHIDFDLSTMVVVVSSDTPLPLEQRIQRGKALYNLASKKQEGNPQEMPVYDDPYQAIEIPAIDLSSTSGTTRSNGVQRTSQRFSLLARGDLAYMNGGLYYDWEDSGKQQLRLDLTRKSLSGNLLGFLQATEVELGDVFAPQIPLIGSADRGAGVVLSNFPISRPTEFDRTTLRGDLPPGWEVQLYRNETLIDATQPNTEGRYEFIDVALLYGNNDLRLVFYGPQGQIREEHQRFNVGRDLVPVGAFHYRAAFNQLGKSLFEIGRQATVEEDMAAMPAASGAQNRFSLEAEYGLSNRISLAGAVASVPTLSGQQSSASIGLRSTYAGMFTRLDAVTTENGGYGAKLATQTRLGEFNLFGEIASFHNYTRAGSNSAGRKALQREASLRVDGIVGSEASLRVPFTLGFNDQRFVDGSAVQDWNLRLSAFLDSVSVSNKLDLRRNIAARGGVNSRTDGELLLGGRLDHVSLRGGLRYKVTPQFRADSIALSAQWLVGQNYNMKSTFDYALASRSARLGMDVNRDYENFAVGLSASVDDDLGYQVVMTFTMAIGPDPRGGALHLSPHSLATQGAASVRTFLDRNGDGQFNRGDELLPEVALAGVSSTRDLRTDDNGVLYAPALGAYNEPELSVDLRSLEDPYWLPSVPGYRIPTRPGHTAVVDIAVTMTGDIEGSTYFRDGGETREVANVNLELVGAEGQVVQTVKSAYDGYYVFSQVRPGNYRIRVKAEQIERLKLARIAARPVVVGGEGEVVDGMDIILRRAPSALASSNAP